MKLVSSCSQCFFFTHLQNKLFYTGFTVIPKRFKDSNIKIYFRVSRLTCCQRNLLTWVLIHGSSPHAAIHCNWYYQPALWHLQPSSDDFVPVCSEKPFFGKKKKERPWFILNSFTSHSYWCGGIPLWEWQRWDCWAAVREEYLVRSDFFFSPPPPRLMTSPLIGTAGTSKSWV